MRHPHPLLVHIPGKDVCKQTGGEESIHKTKRAHPRLGEQFESHVLPSSPNVCYWSSRSSTQGKRLQASGMMKNCRLGLQVLPNCPKESKGLCSIVPETKDDSLGSKLASILVCRCSKYLGPKGRSMPDHKTSPHMKLVVVVW